jgi:YD repeat-containing protein
MSNHDDLWPALDFLECKDSLDALHMQSQVIGKVKLALARPAPEWQQVPLWVNARGLTTGLLRAGATELELAFDLVGHRLEITTTDGRREGFDLVARPLREFTAQVMAALARVGVRVTINPMTVEVPNPVRCDEHEGCDVYDPGIASKFFRVLARIATVFEDFRAGFWGKQTPVGFYWGTFDLAVSRFNLVPVPSGAGMDRIFRVAMDSQFTELGFWPGNEKYPKPAFYAFSYPKPEGIERAVIRPERAGWNAQMGEFLLDYDDVRSSSDPRAVILEFANSTYAAGADLAGWDRTLLDRPPPK